MVDSETSTSDVTMSQHVADVKVQLPDSINLKQQSPVAMAPIVNAGLHGLWVTDEPQVLSQYGQMGVHFVKPGENLVPDEALYSVSDSGFLSNGGDAVVGVISEKAWQSVLEANRTYRKEVFDGVQLLDEAGVPVKPKAGA